MAEPGQKVRHLQRRQAGLAGQRHRPLGCLHRRGEVAQSLFQAGLQVMEIRPVHPPTEGRRRSMVSIRDRASASAPLLSSAVASA
ncbi:MAG: hypothetical protein IPI40_13615 [Betaproteobacteria bacterium]|nr:hypothetical protein [Betaproteobacteria bacterium]